MGTFCPNFANSSREKSKEIKTVFVEYFIKKEKQELSIRKMFTYGRGVPPFGSLTIF